MLLYIYRYTYIIWRIRVTHTTQCTTHTTRISLMLCHLSISFELPHDEGMFISEDPAGSLGYYYSWPWRGRSGRTTEGGQCLGQGRRRRSSVVLQTEFLWGSDSATTSELGATTSLPLLCLFCLTKTMLALARTTHYSGTIHHTHTHNGSSVCVCVWVDSLTCVCMYVRGIKYRACTQCTECVLYIGLVVVYGRVLTHT